MSTLFMLAYKLSFKVHSWPRKPQWRKKENQQRWHSMIWFKAPQLLNGSLGEIVSECPDCVDKTQGTSTVKPVSVLIPAAVYCVNLSFNRTLSGRWRTRAFNKHLRRVSVCSGLCRCRHIVGNCSTGSKSVQIRCRVSSCWVLPLLNQTGRCS